MCVRVCVFDRERERLCVCVGGGEGVNIALENGSLTFSYGHSEHPAL